MISILIIPFNVTHDKVVYGDDINNKDFNVYKVNKTEIELMDDILSSEDNDRLVLSYVYPIKYDFITKAIYSRPAILFVSDINGKITCLDHKEQYESFISIIDTQIKKFATDKYPAIVDIPVIKYVAEEDEEKYKWFTREFRLQLKTEFFNKFIEKKIEKMDNSVLSSNSGSITTFTDLLRHLINVKYAFLGHICIVVHYIPYKSLYDGFFNKNNKYWFPTIYTVEKYCTNASLNELRNKFDNIKISEIESNNDIENYDFITSRGYMLSISNGNVNIEEYSDEAFTSASKMILD